MTVSRIMRVVAVCLAISAMALVAGCGRGGRTEQISVSGSTTILPIAEMAGELYQEQHADTRVLVSGVGSSAGIESVAKGSSDIGTSSRELKDEENSLGLVDTPIAYDGIVVIVNPHNSVKNLTLAQARAVFRGVITNWRELGGPDLPIELVNRDEASGTREAFDKIVLKGEAFDPKAAVLPGTGQVRSVVANAPGAVGYISLGFADTTVKALSIDGITPSARTVRDGSYPVRRVLHFLTKGEPTGVSAKFIEFFLSDEVQRDVVTKAGFTPIESRD